MHIMEGQIAAAHVAERADVKPTSSPAETMSMERISTIAAFEAERERWEELEAIDPHATVFMSWRWLRAYLPTARYRWSILVLRDRGEAVAYLPVADNRSVLDRELYLGGNPVADYTGILALPSRAEFAVAAFADAIVDGGWDGVNLNDVNDPRIETLVHRLEDRGLRTVAMDETRCLSCPLPASWEQYVGEYITAKTRVNLLRVERRLREALPGFRISEPTDADIDAHVEAMIVVNHRRWGGNLRNARRRYGRLFRNAYAAGILRMFVYWDGERPIAGATSFTDEKRSFFGLYMIGFDEAYDKLSPGRGIVGHAIRAAIEGGYERFDFMRGDEEYKSRYAKDLHVTRHFRLTRGGLRAAAIAYMRPKWFALKLAVANVVYGPGRTV